MSTHIPFASFGRMDGAYGEPVIILRGRSCKIAGGLGRIQREFAQKGLSAGIGGGDLLELLQIVAYEDPHSRKAAR